MIKTLLYIVISVLFVTSCYANDAGREIHCPKTIIIEQKISPTENINGLTFNDTNKIHNYKTTWVSTDPNDNKYRLRPDREEETSTSTVENYDLSFYKDKGLEIYLVCEFTQSTATISKKLPDDFRHCDIIYDKHAGLYIERGVYCK